MKQKEDSPMSIVDEAVYELKQLASLCNVMMFVDSNSDGVDIDSDTISRVMCHLWVGLDAQIKVLDGIQWKPEKGRAAA